MVSLLLAVIPFLTAPIQSEQAKVEAQSPLVLVRVGYYVDDHEQDVQRQCQLVVAERDAGVVPPRLVAAFMYWHRKPAGGGGDYRLTLKCDGIIVSTSPEHYDLFGGHFTIVLSACKKPELTFDTDQHVHLPQAIADPYFPIWGGHSGGRWVLRDEWKNLSESLKKKIKLAYALYVSDGGGTFKCEVGYR